MKTKVFYHVLMIHNWHEMVREQLAKLVDSGLYYHCEKVYIGALGQDIETLEEIIKDYDKCDIIRYSEDEKKYEFWTLKIIWHLAQKESFNAVYIHTKGVSFPDNSGGKYWRDYMMHYNVINYKDCLKALREGYDTCGVKLRQKTDSPVYKVHYSGNFWWAKSTYIRKLEDPETMNTKNRFEAEFWIGTANPRTKTLCQDFVDYNTTGTFYKGRNLVHTLAYNLPSETEKSMKLLYDQNSNFEHYVVDLGFPLLTDIRPKDIESSKKRVSEAYRKLADKYGSKYVKLENIGVSQNWEQVWRYLKMSDEDVLIGQDPDERTLTDGWVEAMADVLRGDRYGLVSLMMTDHWGALQNARVKMYNGHKVIESHKGNWALIGMSGKFLRKLGGVPYPKEAERYGWIEHSIHAEMGKTGLRDCVLRDYRVRHTDFSLGDEGTSRLLREWKNLIIFELKKYGQISFEDYLTGNYKCK